MRADELRKLQETLEELRKIRKMIVTARQKQSKGEDVIENSAEEK